MSWDYIFFLSSNVIEDVERICLCITGTKYYEMSGAQTKKVEMTNNNCDEGNDVKPVTVNRKSWACSLMTNCKYLKSNCQTV